MNIIWRQRAEQALQHQLAYIRDRNPAAADRVRDRIDERVAQLTQFPFSGRASGTSGLRELVIGDTPHIAVYRVRANEIEILRFFHASQNR